MPSNLDRIPPFPPELTLEHAVKFEANIGTYYVTNFTYKICKNIKGKIHCNIFYMFQSVMKGIIFNLHRSLVSSTIAETGNHVFYSLLFTSASSSTSDLLLLDMQFSKCLRLWVYILAKEYFSFVLNTRYKMHETFLYPFMDVKSKYTQRINQRSALKQNIIFTDCKIGHYRHSYIEICMHSFEREKKIAGNLHFWFYLHFSLICSIFIRALVWGNQKYF